MAIAVVHETAPRLETAHSGGCQILWELLDRWMALDETRVTWQEVDDLYGDIVGMWRAFPGEVDAWYLAWRAVRETCRAPIPAGVPGRPEGPLDEF